MSTTTCGKCGAVVETPNSSTENCPTCGERLSLIAISVGDEVGITLREKLGLKVRHGLPGQIRPDLEKVVGDDLQRSTGRRLRIERTIDRENDAYAETLTDPETGEIVLDKQERLSEHQGRGAARPKSPEPPRTIE